MQRPLIPAGESAMEPTKPPFTIRGYLTSSSFGRYVLVILATLFVVYGFISLDETVVGNTHQHFEVKECDMKIQFIEGLFCGHDFNTTFFVETAYKTSLGPREACAIESVARANGPNPVVVYMTGLQLDEMKEKLPWIQNYTNLKVSKLYLDDIYRTNDFKHVFYSHDMQFGPHRTEHVADYTRIWIMKNLGGLYLDLDWIVQKNMLTLGEFICSESEQFFINGIIRLKKDSVLINHMYESLSRNKYNSYSWTGAGPSMVTASAKEVCGISPSQPDFETIQNKCNISAFKPRRFFPIAWQEWEGIFQKDMNISTWRPYILNETYGVHFNSHLTKEKLVKKNDSTILSQMAKLYCPMTFETFPDEY